MRGQVSDVDLRLLRVFAAIVDCGGFGAAAARLNIAESTISSHMHDLEQRLGMRLCERGRAGFRLTRDGHTVYRAAAELLGSVEAFRDRLASARQQMSGTLSLGMSDSTITHPGAPLHQAIAAFFARQNDVRLTVQVMTPRELERGVLEGQLDLAIAPEHQRVAGLDYRRLFREENLFYCGRAHPFFARADNGLELAEIAGADRISRGYLAMFDRRFFGPGAHRATVYHVEAAAVLIRSGRFLGFLPAHYAAAWVAAGEMRPLLPQKLRFLSEFNILTRRAEKPDLIVATFVEDLRAAHAAAPAAVPRGAAPR